MIYERVCQLIRIVDAVAARTRMSQAYHVASGAWPDETEAARERRRREEQEAENRREEQRKQELVELKTSEREALRVASTSVEQAADLCDRAVRRRALMAYFGGMLIGVLIFTLLGIALGQILAGVDITGFNLERFLTTFIAGAVGAIVSVMTRLSGSGVVIDYETGTRLSRITRRVPSSHRSNVRRSAVLRYLERDSPSRHPDRPKPGLLLLRLHSVPRRIQRALGQRHAV